jgi:hypothetical protein
MTKDEFELLFDAEVAEPVRRRGFLNRCSSASEIGANNVPRKDLGAAPPLNGQ